MATIVGITVEHDNPKLTREEGQARDNILHRDLVSVSDAINYSLDRHTPTEMAERVPVKFGIHPFFRWYDLWVGAYYDRHTRTLYVCPLPTIGVAIQFAG